MAILLDFGGTIFSSIFVDMKNGGEPQLEYIRHLVLNTIRAYNKRFRSDYGMMHICFDSKSWRDDVYEYYKWERRHNRANETNTEWDKIFEYITEIQEDLKHNFPFICIGHHGAEADDSIAYLAAAIKEPNLIISNDKDLVALTQLGNVDQFRPFEKGNNLFIVDDPERYEFDLIVSGDKADGIPNIRGEDDFYKKQVLAKEAGEKVVRAKPVSAKIKEEWWDIFKASGEAGLKASMGDELYERYLRNRRLISFREMPEDVEYGIRRSLGRARPASVMKALTYMTSKRMNLLAKEIGDFTTNDNPKLKRSLFDMTK